MKSTPARKKQPAKVTKAQSREIGRAIKFAKLEIKALSERITDLIMAEIKATPGLFHP